VTAPTPSDNEPLAALDAEMDAHLNRDPEAVDEEFNRRFRQAWEDRA